VIRHAPSRADTQVCPYAMVALFIQRPLVGEA
jgi:hypothetical protein